MDRDCREEAIRRNEEAYGEEARSLFGDRIVDAANDKLRAMGDSEWDRLSALEEDIKEQLRVAMATGDATGKEAKRLVRMHATWLAAHWPDGAYTKEAHRALAEGYLQDPRFVAYYDGACGDGATKFLRDAIVGTLGIR